MRNKFKHITAYLLLAFFITIKFAGLHVFTHNQDKDHVINCSICDHIIANDNSPLLPTQAYEFTVATVEKQMLKPVSTSYYFQYSTQDIDKHLFSRPPPSV